MAEKKFPQIFSSGFARVKLYKNRSTRTKSGFIYQAAWHDGEKRRLKQFHDLKEATHWSKHKAAAIRAGRAAFDNEDADTLTAAQAIIGDTPLMDALLEWKSAKETLGSAGTLQEAAAFYRKQHPEGATRLTIEEAVEAFTAAKARNGIDTRTAYKDRLQRLANSLSGTPVGSITTKDLSSHLAQFSHPVTRNTHRKNMITLFRWLRRNGYLPDATTAAEKTDAAQESDSAIEFFTPPELAQALQIISTRHPHYLPALTVAAFAGLRRAEAEAQVWEDIDLHSGTLTVTKAKPRTPADRIVELPRAAIDWLMRCEHRKGRIGDTDHDLDRIRKILRTAGIETPSNGFRHSAITYKMALGLSAGQVAGWAGTSERQIHKHYRRPRPKAEAEHWFSLNPDTIPSSSNVKIAGLA